jgi:hypothetical protein
VVALLLGGCALGRDQPPIPASAISDAAPSDPGTAVPAPAVVAPAVSRPAARALAAYLDASRDGSPTAATRDTLLGCGARGAFVLPIAMLGGYRVLPTRGTGDTLLGRAVVVTVAEQRADRRSRGRFLARQRVEVDTVEWDLVRDATGSWRVCNGLQFGFHVPDDRTTWFPSGASYATARRLADSVYRAWNGGPAP